MGTQSVAPASRWRRWSRHTAVRVFLVVLVLSLAAAGYHRYWAHFECRFRTISPGKVFQSAEMPKSTLTETVEEHGIRTVIDLRRAESDNNDAADIEEERATLEALGARHVHLPSGQIPTRRTMGQFFRVMDDPANYPVLIHCFHGYGKSRLLSAIYLIEYEDWTNDDARLAQRGLSFVYEGAFAKDSGKGRFVHEFVPRRLRDPAKKR